MQDQQPEETFDTISIYILRVKAGLTQKIYEYKPSMEVTHANFTQSTQVVLEVNLIEGSYLIIPCTFNPGFESNFQLRVLQLGVTEVSSIPKLRLLSDVKWVSIKGEWRPETAGGTINNKSSWRKNQQFSLSVKKTLTMDIVLAQKHPHPTKALFGIGFIIFDGNGKPVENLETPIVFKAAYILDEQVKEEVTLNGPKSYTIVPTTFHPNECCSFQLQVTVPSDPSGISYVSVENI